MERAAFRHTTGISIRNYEVDWQGIVHNANYRLYCQVGRIRYVQDLGVPVTIDTLQGEFRIVAVRNEIDYRSAARYGEELNILTRIAVIGNSSVRFEGIIEECSTARLIAENASVHVWLDRATSRSVRVPEEFRRLVRSIEGENCRISS